MRSRVVALTFALLVLMVALPTSSSGDPPVECEKKDPTTGLCLIWVPAPPPPPVGGGGGGGGDPVDPPGGGGPNLDPCTYQVADPQPSASHPVWGGNTSADGVVYLQVCPRPDGYGSGFRTAYVFVANGADPPVGVPIDPAILAEQAIASMTMLAPPIGMAPPQGSEGAISGVPVWMWVEQGESTTGPTDASASAGGVTVTAVGSVTEVTWGMGDGSSVSCGVGTPYNAGYGGSASPDCGYVYEVKSTKSDPNGVYTVTASSTWTITWSGGGESGTEVLELSSSVPLRVTEINVLNVPGG